MDREYIDAQIAELRTLLLDQVKSLSEQIDRLCREQRESRLRQEKLESGARRF